MDPENLRSQTQPQSKIMDKEVTASTSVLDNTPYNVLKPALSFEEHILSFLFDIITPFKKHSFKVRFKNQPCTLDHMYHFQPLRPVQKSRLGPRVKQKERIKTAKLCQCKLKQNKQWI